MAFDMGYLYSVGVDVRCTSVMTPVKSREPRLSESVIISLVWCEHGQPAARLWHIRIHCLANTVLLNGTRQGSLKQMAFSGNIILSPRGVTASDIMSYSVSYLRLSCVLSAFFVICFSASIVHCFYHSTQSSLIPLAT